MKIRPQQLTKAVAVLLSLSLSGCAFVTLTDAGAQVRQSSAADVADCKLVATIASQTKSLSLIHI